MREIKFRAWDAHLGFMINLYCELKDGNFWGEDCTNTGFSVNPEHVMQFTGRNDINGKDIYDGDIVDDLAGERLAVEWNDDTCMWQFSNGEPINSGENYGKIWVVIGNIYQNPDLLK